MKAVVQDRSELGQSDRSVVPYHWNGSVGGFIWDETDDRCCGKTPEVVVQWISRSGERESSVPHSTYGNIGPAVSTSKRVMSPVGRSDWPPTLVYARSDDLVARSPPMPL
jgi:hypothetical protein